MYSGNSLRRTTTLGSEKERERVYDTIFRLPWRCEVLIDVGFFVCFDAFLSLLTIIPTRILIKLWRFLTARQFKRLSAAKMCDFGCFLVLACGVILLGQTGGCQGTIKLYMIYNVLELMDTNAQLWYIIREYISNSEEQGVDQADLIAFLLELSFHTPGEAYSLDTLTDDQTTMIKDLADLGLVKLQKGRKESWFIPTKLATNLSVSLTDSSSRKQGFVVVETNFRMYAYSSSKLHCEILRLFARVEYQLPNLIVGAITKESLYNAFENGITAEQIVTFLQQNAHPRVAEKLPSVPENVTDQIRLWETDLNRVEMTPAHFYDEFPSRDVFEAASDFARMHNGLLWEDAKKMRMVVKAEIHMLMREHLRGQNK